MYKRQIIPFNLLQIYLTNAEADSEEDVSTNEHFQIILKIKSNLFPSECEIFFFSNPIKLVGSKRVLVFILFNLCVNVSICLSPSAHHP